MSSDMLGHVLSHVPLCFILIPVRNQTHDLKISREKATLQRTRSDYLFCTVATLTYFIRDVKAYHHISHYPEAMGLLPDTQNCGLRMLGNAGNVFPATDLKGNRWVSDPSMHQGTCVTHVPCCMSGSLTRCGTENVPGIPGACTTRNFTYLKEAHFERYHLLLRYTKYLFHAKVPFWHASGQIASVEELVLRSARKMHGAYIIVAVIM